jgi:hypothetical protein
MTQRGSRGSQQGPKTFCELKCDHPAEGSIRSLESPPMIVAHAGKVMNVFASMEKDHRLKWFL